MLQVTRLALMARTTLSGLILAACGGLPAVPPTLSPVQQPIQLPPATTIPTVELQFFAPFGAPLALENPRDHLDRYIALFNEMHPQIHVTLVPYDSNDDALPAIQKGLQEGKVPVALLGNELPYEMADISSLLPTDDYITNLGDSAYRNDFFQAFWRDSQFEGKVYGVPFSREVLLLYYNQDLFTAAGLDATKPPTTWDDLVKDAQTLTLRDAANHPVRWGVENAAQWDFFQALAQSNGQNLVNDDGTQATFNHPAVLKALQDWIDLYTTSKVMPAFATRPDVVLDSFRDGKAAMMIQYSDFLLDVLKQAKFSVGVAALPAKKQSQVPTDGLNLYLFKQTSPSQPAAADEFIRFLTSPEILADWSVHSGSIAVRQSAYNTAGLKTYSAAHPQALVARAQLQNATPGLLFRSPSPMRVALGKHLRSALFGTVTAQEALANLQKEADAILTSQIHLH